MVKESVVIVHRVTDGSQITETRKTALHTIYTNTAGVERIRFAGCLRTITRVNGVPIYVHNMDIIRLG